MDFSAANVQFCRLFLKLRRSKKLRLPAACGTLYPKITGDTFQMELEFGLVGF